MRAEMQEDPFYRTCARAALLGDHVCQRSPLRPYQAVEWEHALYFGPNKVQKPFAIVPLCWWAHTGPGMNKEIAVWIALNRATPEELDEISKDRDYKHELERLNGIYGVPTLPDPEIVYD